MRFLLILLVLFAHFMIVFVLGTLFFLLGAAVFAFKTAWLQTAWVLERIEEQ